MAYSLSQICFMKELKGTTRCLGLIPFIGLVPVIYDLVSQTFSYTSFIGSHNEGGCNPGVHILYLFIVYLVSGDWDGAGVKAFSWYSISALIWYLRHGELLVLSWHILPSYASDTTWFLLVVSVKARYYWIRSDPLIIAVLCISSRKSPLGIGYKSVMKNLLQK